MTAADVARIRRTSAISLACIVLPVLLSVLPVFAGQDAAGDAMLSGLASLVLLVVGLPMGISAWRAANRAGSALDRTTLLLSRAPVLLLIGLVGLGVIAGILATAGA
jgi:hypothetical protein